MAGAGARRGLAGRSDEGQKMCLFSFLCCAGRRAPGRAQWGPQHCRGVCARPHSGQTGLEGRGELRLRLHVKKGPPNYCTSPLAPAGQALRASSSGKRRPAAAHVQHTNAAQVHNTGVSDALLVQVAHVQRVNAG